MLTGTHMVHATQTLGALKLRQRGYQEGLYSRVICWKTCAVAMPNLANIIITEDYGTCPDIFWQTRIDALRLFKTRISGI